MCWGIDLEDSFQGFNPTGGYIESWETARDSPLEMVVYNSDDYPLRILAVKESYFRSSQGHSKTVSLEVKPEWTELLREAIEKLELEWKEPQWLLASMQSL